jgi:adenine-specific DNA-methyltransferase
LALQVPRSTWHKLTFIDAFLGGGAVSVFAKATGFKQLFVNDCSTRAQMIAQAFLSNDHVTLSRRDLLFLNQPLPDGEARIIEAQYAPSVFSTRHAQRLDQWLYWANQIQDPTRRALYRVWIWHCLNTFLCYPTSRGTSNGPYAQALDGDRSWDTINPKRFQDGTIDRLLKPSLEIMEAKLKTVNQGVFQGSPVTVYQEDALTFLPSVSGDIVYLDPPYAGTQGYDQGFALIDGLLFPKQQPMALTDFSSSVEALHALLESVQHIPTWVLSYGNKTIDLDKLVAVVQQHAKHRQVKGYSKAYSHMRHVAKRLNNQELLVIASGGV